MTDSIKDILLSNNYIIKNSIYSQNKKKDFIAEQVSTFYEKIPFPSYKTNDNKFTILESGEKNIFYNNLKKYFGLNKKILEIGSGTSQLSNYLAIGTNNEVVAFDLTRKSLKLGRDFAKQNKINNIKFIEGDIFEQEIFSNLFDFVLTIGVLHHTKNPYEAFLKSLEPLKSGGYIVLGLYNSYGRKRLEFRRFLFKLFGKRIIYLFDPLIRYLSKNKNINKDKIDAWINDQYFHPVEKSFTIDEVMKWFKDNKIELISSIPTMDFNKKSGEKIFVKENICNLMFRIIKQIIMNFQDYGKEGGLFIVIGKKCK